MINKKVVVDSDAIYAIYNQNDPLHKKAQDTLKWLSEQEVQLIYPTSVIFEIMSLFQRVLKSPDATEKLVNMMKEELLVIQTIDEELLKESVDNFNPRGSKKNTLVDCSVAVIARKLKAASVFSFDSFYTKQGLTLAEDLV